MVSPNLAMSDRRVSRQGAFETVDLLGLIPSSDANGPNRRYHGIFAEEPQECASAGQYRDGGGPIMGP
jgi:hypothetical protein